MEFTEHGVIAYTQSIGLLESLHCRIFQIYDVAVQSNIIEANLGCETHRLYRHALCKFSPTPTLKMARGHDSFTA
jgi:hypothetical protein